MIACDYYTVCDPMSAAELHAYKNWFSLQYLSCTLYIACHTFTIENLKVISYSPKF